MSTLKPTDTAKFLGELTGGAFADQVGAALSDVAECVIASGNKGQVTIVLDIAQVGDKESAQVNVKHKVTYKAPERYGERSESYTRVTPMHVNKGGEMSLFANHTADLFSQTNQETDV